MYVKRRSVSNDFLIPPRLRDGLTGMHVNGKETEQVLVFPIMETKGMEKIWQMIL